MSASEIQLDVREDFQNGREPFSRIMGVVDSLEPGQALRLLAPLEPVPLIGLLTQRGFRHASRQLPSGDWEVVFEPGVSATTADLARAERPAGPAGPADAAGVELDLRGLEPPLPLVRILQAVASLPPGIQLHARTDRQPHHLYAQLESRGWRGESEEQDDGSFITHIRHL